MMLHKRHSFFPFVLALLTLALVILMFYAFTGREPAPAERAVEPSPVSASRYEGSLVSLMDAFIGAYDAQPDDASRLALTEQALADLLSLRVPADEKDRHLALAVGLNRLEQALRARDAEETQAAFDEIASTLRAAQ
ncbi:hypothetical protein FJZ23_02850 [Candidatus Parcubacteria bacterium]|nr:hypothetical protein [Candidatus Parcubacteria bacterium]